MIFSLVIGFCAAQLSAQSFNTLTVTSPSSIAGDYAIVNANFGLDGVSPDVDPISGTLALAADAVAPESDACTELTNDLTGTIGLIDRGTCPFVDKVTFGEAAGAIAVLVCNNQDGPPIGMASDDPPVLGEAISIYSAMASRSDCNLIKAAIGDGENVEITFSYKAPECNTNYDDTVVWGANGEGEFDGGLGDWESVGVTAETDVFVHVPEGANRGAIRQGANTIESPSLCNGAMILDFDFLSTGGDGAVLNSLGFPYPQHNGALVSPTIDLSDVEFPMVEFYQFQLPLNGGGTFSYSIDNGDTWFAEDPVDTENVLTASIENIVGTEMVTIFLPEAANQSEVKIRFSGASDFYFWLIDDVIIRDIRIADVRANSNFYAVAQNFKTPINQVDEMAFLIDIENIGNVDVTGANVNATIVQDATGDVVYSADLEYGQIDLGFLDENRVFPDVWVPTNELGTYTGSYTLTSDNDDNNNNNVQTFGYEITEETFAKVLSEEEAGVQYLGDRAAPDEYYQSYGNHYYIPNGAGLYAKEISFGVTVADPAASNGFITLGIYQWIDDGDGVCQGGERIPIWEKTDILISEESTAAELRNMTFDLRPELVELQDNAHYITLASMRPISTSGDQYRIVAANTGVQPAFNYGAMGLAFTNEFEKVRYGSVSGNGTGGDDVSSRELFSNGVWSVYMPLTIGLISDVDEVNNDLNIKIFPNPAVDQLVVDLILDNNSETVGLNLTTLDGRVVLTQNANNVQNTQVTMNIADVPAGMYMLNITTEDGYTSKKVVVAK